MSAIHHQELRSQNRERVSPAVAIDAARDALAEGLRGKYPAACIVLAEALKSSESDADDQARWAKHYQERGEALENRLEKLKQMVTTEHETKSEFIARARAIITETSPPALL